LPILITGASGQDGRLLAHKFTGEGKKVVGLCRPGKKEELSRYNPLVTVIEIDLRDEKKLVEVLDFVKPSAIYNLAGFSSVIESWKNPTSVTTINSLVPSTILRWCVFNQPSVRLIQASSSEIFGGATVSPQNEDTPISPITPYGLSKSFSHSLLQQFRSEYGLHASNAILYNHESPLRDPNFVTRKISKAVAAISKGSRGPINLGKTNSRRDWGWAPDHVDAMYRIEQQDEPGDYVISTGKDHSVDDILKFAFEYVGIKDYSEFVKYDQSSDRKVDPTNLVGNHTLSTSKLDWSPTKSLKEIIEAMVDFDIRLIDSAESVWYPKK
jgi:GDPmannose 4,6-dehydratase